MSGVGILTTSDVNFANGTESVIKQVTDQGFELPRHIRTIYRLSDKQATLIEERATRSLLPLSVERAPA
jgi:phenylalanine-4-hydroxylase